MCSQGLVDYLVIPGIVFFAFCSYSHFIPTAVLRGGYHYSYFMDENFGSDGESGFEFQICLADFKSRDLSVLPYSSNPEFFFGSSFHISH